MTDKPIATVSVPQAWVYGLEADNAHLRMDIADLRAEIKRLRAVLEKIANLQLHPDEWWIAGIAEQALASPKPGIN